MEITSEHLALSAWFLHLPSRLLASMGTVLLAVLGEANPVGSR
uniref:Uncharacterized protein n=1 Tax=Arundo donax TaxID=35708 RepID=A0A0A9I3G3_ARUDO